MAGPRVGVRICAKKERSNATNPCDVPSRAEFRPSSMLSLEGSSPGHLSEWDESGGVGRFERGT